MKTMKAALESVGLTGASVAQVVNSVFDRMEAEPDQSEQRKSNAKEENMTTRQFVLTNPEGPASQAQRRYIARLTKQVNGKGIYITDALTRAEAANLIGKLQAKLGIVPGAVQKPRSTSRADVEALLK